MNRAALVLQNGSIWLNSFPRPKLAKADDIACGAYLRLRNDVDREMRRPASRFHNAGMTRSTLFKTVFAVAISVILSMASAVCLGLGRPASASDLKNLSLEELMTLEVTSVSRTEETLGQAAAAIAVVTNEDIRRAGVTTIPGALRLLPGIYVGRRSSNSWAVSARGFSSVNSEKLLVLSDTRSIYTPLYSGVFWDVQDFLLQDIERVEVIRGPGAALWGSNAVNGVINISTKSAKDTQGFYWEAAGGNEERVNAALRYGGRAGEGGYYRVFAKYSDRDSTYNPTASSSDDWRLTHAGFRSDWDLNTADALTVQGDVYSGNIGQLAPSVTIIGRPGPTQDLRVDVSGGNVLSRWRHTFNAQSDFQLRFYYDHTHRNDPSYVDTLDTFDIDLQHRLALSGSQEILWGLNYRYTDNQNEGRGIFAVDPVVSQDNVFSAFVQDQITWRKTWRLTLGTKLEQNDFSDFEWQPSVRLVKDLSASQILWAAISRAARVPTRLERDIAIDITDPAGNPIARLLGNKDFKSEKLLAYELGYRWQIAKAVAIDVAAFHNRYTDLASLELGAIFIDPRDGRTVIPIVNQNLTDGEANGIEALITYAPLPRWRLTATYTYTELKLDPRGADLNRGSFLEGSTPKHQFGLRSFVDLPGNFELDAQFRHLSAIASIPEIVSGAGIDGYSELDMRVAWHGWRSLEVSVVGQNLLHARHPEFGAPASRGEIERGVYAKVAWGF